MHCPRCHRSYEDDTVFCPYDGAELTASRSLELVSSRPTRLNGAVLGKRYVVKGFIGKGAMARVYLAEDLETGDPVAIKVLDAQHGRGGKRSRERFLREAGAANRIGHPNIVKILDFGERSDGAPFIVMEFLFGEPLGELLRREGKLSPDIALPILKQAASGLAAAHKAGIVHRDVKPDNLFLVGEPGDPYAVKILDFGLAKLSEQSGFTASGVAVGTLEYMSPEQVVTDKCDDRTDVYGLGVVAFRALVGTLPFSAKEDAAMLAHQLVLPTPPPSVRASGIDPRVEAIILKATRKRPDNRYRTMEDMCHDLERVLGERSGPLCAEEPLEHDPDVYRPSSSFARHAAKFFYKKLGMAPPDWGN